jgi:hypothetical protein
MPTGEELVQMLVAQQGPRPSPIDEALQMAAKRQGLNQAVAGMGGQMPSNVPTPPPVQPAPAPAPQPEMGAAEKLMMVLRNMGIVQ